MARACPLLSLSNELLRTILDHIEADPDKLVALDRRGYLSQESFAIPPPALSEQARDLSNLRRTCHRLADLGAIHQFARWTTRFSHTGLARLEKIAEQRHLSKHVRKLSYLLPNFYVKGRARVRDVLPVFDVDVGLLDAKHFDSKYKEQREILSSGEDLKILRKAAAAFTNLQHVQILRLQDQEDAALISYLRQHDELVHLVQLRWPPACQHGTETIGTALVDSRSSCSRFSSPMASGQSASSLSPQLSKKMFKSLTSNLTSLELHFDDAVNLDRLMEGLSDLFKELFSRALNMQSIHIGFPSHRPLELRLEQVFHNVRWKKLSAFGIQAWKLDADEIIELLRRHRDRLRGLRLRDVLLNEGSMWKDVLEFLHDEMPHLDWVRQVEQALDVICSANDQCISLRRIGYTSPFEAQWTGAEIPDDPPGGDSDSSDEEIQPTGHRLSIDSERESTSHEDTDDDTSSEARSDDEDEGPQAYDMGFPPLSPGTPTSAPYCTLCSDHGMTEIDEDNGLTVTNSQRKKWEKWVVHRRLKHPSNLPA